MFIRGFDSYVIEGDSIICEAEGFTVTAKLVHDDNSRPTDFECYAPEHIEAWNRDEWHYMGIVLSVELNGVMLDNLAASLWGIEANFPGGDNSYFLEVANELLPEAISRAKDARLSMLESLSMQ